MRHAIELYGFYVLAGLIVGYVIGRLEEQIKRKNRRW